MSSSATNPLEWTNPIVEQRADPHVHLHTDGFYYLTGSVPAYDCIELRRARTLGELSSAEPQVVWKKHSSGPMSGFIWAPEIHYVGDKWYVYFAASEAEDIWKIRMYVIENASPDPLAGNWIEKGRTETNWESFSLDATTFEHRGTRYLVWAQNDPKIKGNTNLYIAEMNTPWSITGKQVLITKPELPWECIGHLVNEGPSVIIRNGRIFMTYSASATDANYCLGLLTAEADADLLDPTSWKKSPGPIMATTPENKVFGPGHNSFTTTPDGKTDIIVYHARNYRDIEGEPLYNPDRHARAQVLHWNADGTPDFGVPVPDGPVS